MGVLPSDLPHLTSLLLTSFPQWAKGSDPDGELPIACLPPPRPPGWLPAGCTPAPYPHSPGYHSQVALPRSVGIPSPLQTNPGIPSQRRQGLASSPPHPFLFLSFYLLLLFYFLIFCSTASLFQALCTSGVSHSSEQGLERSSQGSPGMGD